MAAARGRRRSTGGRAGLNDGRATQDLSSADSAGPGGGASSSLFSRPDLPSPALSLCVSSASLAAAGPHDADPLGQRRIEEEEELRWRGRARRAGRWRSEECDGPHGRRTARNSLREPERDGAAAVDEQDGGDYVGASTGDGGERMSNGILGAGTPAWGASSARTRQRPSPEP